MLMKCNKPKTKPLGKASASNFISLVDIMRLYDVTSVLQRTFMMEAPHSVGPAGCPLWVLEGDVLPSGLLSLA